MTDLESLPPAGWYRDPVDPAGLRWWDGSEWTTHDRPAEPATPAPAPAFGSVAWRDEAVSHVSEVRVSPIRRPSERANRVSTVALVFGILFAICEMIDPFADLAMLVDAVGTAVLIGLAGLGLALWSSTGNGFKRSVAGLLIGLAVGAFATFGAVGSVGIPGFT